MYAALKTALATALRNNSPLAALLASATAIYYRRPPRERALPCLIYLVEDQPQPALSGCDHTRVHLTISIWSASGGTNDAILVALDAAVLAAHQSGALAPSGWRVALCRRADARIAGEDRLRDGDPVATADAAVERRDTHWILDLVKL